MRRRFPTRIVQVRCRHEGGVEVLRTGWEVNGCPGLAMHASTTDRHGCWTVTHISTGLGVVFRIDDARQAIEIIKALDAPLHDGNTFIDWTVSGEVLDYPAVQDAMELAMHNVKVRWPGVLLGNEDDAQPRANTTRHHRQPREASNA